MHPRPPRARRARPLADAPIAELLARSEELAKGWLLALVERAPLERAATIMAGGIVADGPRICVAMLSALADDGDLARLEPGGLLEPLISGAGGFGAGDGVEAALESVEALHGVLWAALRAELRDPEPDLVYGLAERLAAVTELVRAAAVRAQLDGDGGSRAPVKPTSRSPVTGSEGPSQSPVTGSEVPSQSPVTGSEGPSQSPVTGSEGPSPIPSVESEAAGVSEAPAPAPPSGHRGGRDEALWVAALEDEIVRSRRTGAPLCLLLAELDESGRLEASEHPERPTAAFGRFAQAVRGVLRRQDLLASEDAARAWVIARDTTRPGAAALADRIAAAVATLEPVHGAPLTVSVGVAVLDEDAHDAASLLEAAEEACFAAAASGAPVVGGPADPGGTG